MFVRRRGCRLQVIRSYRDEDGKPRHETLGVVGVFDKKIVGKIAKTLAAKDKRWLKTEMTKAASIAVGEAREILDDLVTRSDIVTDVQLMDDRIYVALSRLATFGTDG